MRPLPVTAQTPLDHALYIAQTLNAPVFPIIENGRIPAIGGWQHRATTDEAKIRAMWTEHDPVLGTTRIKNYNVGVYTGGFLVGDVDVKQGKQGQATYDELDVLYGFPETFTVRTPSGGLHLYYRPEAPARSGVNNVGPGFDTRGVGGYVVGPGSVVDGRAYEIVNAAPIATAPRWFEDKVGKPEPKAEKKQVVELLDTPPAVDRATQWLKNAAPAIEGQGGDAYTFKVAARLKDFGVGQLTALELMAEHWNPRCSPEWDFEHLAIKVANAYQYGKRPIGDAAPEAEFEAVPADPFTPKAPKSKLYVRDFADIQPRLSDTYLVQKWLGEEAMSVVYGESNTGKTFFAMSMAFAVATGGNFGTRRVTKGAVVYVAAEAGVSAENRVAALRQHHKTDRAPFGLVPCPVDLLRPNGDIQALVELVKDYEAKHGKVRLVVVDTLSRAIAGGNENSPDDMGALVKHLDVLRVATKAHVMVIHHSGKDTAKGARGHSLLRAATDTEIEITEGMARATKQRDMEMGEPISFDLAVVPLGRSADGEDVTSCVAVPVDGASLDFGGNPARNALVVRALKAAVEANLGKPVSWETWQSTCNKYILEGETLGFDGAEKGGKWQSPGNSTNKALRTIRDRLAENGVVKVNKKKQWVMG